jgi:choline/glycine/proline betaine transport protein
MRAATAATRQAQRSVVHALPGRSQGRNHSMENQEKTTGARQRLNRKVTAISVVIVGLAMVFGVIYSDVTAEVLARATQALNPFLSWYYVVLVAFLLFFVVWLGIGRFKNVRLGGDDEVPEFTFFSWAAMLFAAGTGAGLLFWSVAQPILQFQENPYIEEGLTPEAARVAMRLTFFHWGLNGWAIFAFVALALGYFGFRHGRPLTIRSTLYPVLGQRASGWIGDLVDALAVVGTLFGIATSLGLGVKQMNAGLDEVFGWSPSVALQLGITAVIIGIAVLSLISGVQRGMRLLSEFNFWLSIVVLLFMLGFGPTQYLIGLTVEATGDYLDNLFALSFHTNVNEDTGWQAEWTVFFWGWWLAWSPFVGMFIARISRGRTLREFVTGVLLVPTLVTIVWIGIFGGTALFHQLFGEGGIVAAVAENVATAVYATVDAMDLGWGGTLISAALIVLIATYLITSANAGTLVVNTILASGESNPSRSHRIFWGVTLGLLTGVLLIAGGLETLQAAVILAALPFSVVVIGMIVGLLRALQYERFAAREGQRKIAPREPWAAETETTAPGGGESPQQSSR